MARAGQNLFLRKTLRVTSSTTFNAPGNYLPPYGSTVIKIGGRGASGNNTTPAIPGNLVPGNVSGSNPGSPGNVAGNNPATLSGHNYGTWMYSGHYQTSWTNSPPGRGPGPLTFFPAINAPNPPASYDGGHGAHPQPWQYAAPYTSPAAYDPDFGQHATQAVNWSGANYNGSANFTPGNPNFNPFTPGNPNFNPNTTNPNTPAVPGNAGSSVNIEGVTFPGGPSDSAAPVVPQTATAIVYTGSNISITVPTGGYITIENV
jgi:hypothetical protein